MERPSPTSPMAACTYGGESERSDDLAAGSWSLGSETRGASSRGAPPGGRQARVWRCVAARFVLKESDATNEHTSPRGYRYRI